MQIVKLSEQNVAALAHLFVELWPECTYETEFEYCKQILEKENQTAFLVNEKGEYIAFAYLSLRNDFVEGATSYPIAYLEGIYVEESFRKTGIASKLIQRAEQWAKENGSSQLASDVEINNEQSIRFHNKSGFLEENRIVCFIKDLKSD
ncbi:MAG: GNAT family N-acetyltransferase [Balneola sp.]|nr:GNAT family N-acetyltransferase [Balneola sp.]MBO6651408.1 GNAT family N-acetyltransferase [Balneola sp.]MBO6710965.1 GNAT family N-acetyltransferase [Balneola sp.]MBO6799652.1 GNAT family N-acetyltransferase [Balneola sp.]MBO6870385.1 GNAT family N-acetyltransferase [Balneola sp.]